MYFSDLANGISINVALRLVYLEITALSWATHGLYNLKKNDRETFTIISLTGRVGGLDSPAI